jgi:hypothetical protein
MADINWGDPCERARALREARLRLISGLGPQSVEYASNETHRRVIYQPADLARLEQEIANADADCSAATGGVTPARRRYALTAGSRWPWG